MCAFFIHPNAALRRQYEDPVLFVWTYSTLESHTLEKIVETPRAAVTLNENIRNNR